VVEILTDVKWIKIQTHMFDDEKIDFIESLPEADSILIIWIKLLTLSGKCNAGGFILLTENIPYSEEMLSHKFRKPTNVIRLALETFKRLNMIYFDGEVIKITNWEKHQNIEGMERIKEQNRLRKQKERENKRLGSVMSRDVTEDVTQSHATDIDIELDIDIDIDIDKEKEKEKEKDIKKKKVKIADHVSMTEEQQQKLLEKLGPELTADFIERLDLYIASKGVKYKCHYSTILAWHRKDGAKPVGKQQKIPRAFQSLQEWGDES
jgi:predicted phage replisome organizer